MSCPQNSDRTSAASHASACLSLGRLKPKRNRSTAMQHKRTCSCWTGTQPLRWADEKVLDSAAIQYIAVHAYSTYKPSESVSQWILFQGRSFVDCCALLSGLNAGLIKQHTTHKRRIREWVTCCTLHVARCMLLHIDKTPPDSRMDPTHETAITSDPACLGRRGRTYSKKAPEASA